jgi:hypothetical protein
MKRLLLSLLLIPVVAFGQAQQPIKADASYNVLPLLINGHPPNLPVGSTVNGVPIGGGGGGGTWGSITGTLSDQTDLQAALDAKQATLTPAALTKTDDTNVTLTLGGTPATALLQAASLTLGWAGQLGLSRGGTAAYLSDPGANRLWGWDDTDNAIKFITIGTNLSYDHSTHTLSSTGGGTPGGSDTQFQYNNSGAFGGIASLTYDGTIPVTLTLDNLGDGADPIDGIFLRNTTAATSPAPTQISPAIHWLTHTWDGAASVPIEFGAFVGGYGAGTADGDWVLASKVNNGSWNFALDFDADNPLTGPTLYIYGGLNSKEITIGNDANSGSVTLTQTQATGLSSVRLQSDNTNDWSILSVVPNGTGASGFQFFGTDFVADSTNYELLNIVTAGSASGLSADTIGTQAGGTGTVRPINLTANGSANQLYVGTDGGVSVGTATAAGSTNLKVAGTVTGSNLSGTNTGDQTSIVGITGTLSEFNTALTGADFATGGGTVTGTSSGTNTGDQTITLTGDVTGSGTGSFATTIARKIRNPGCTIDGGGSAISTGKAKGFATFPVAGTITGWSIAVDTGTATVKVWKKATGTAVPTVSDNINTSGVAISTGTYVHSNTVSDFTTTTVSAGDIFAFNVSAVSGATELTFQLEITP